VLPVGETHADVTPVGVDGPDIEPAWAELLVASPTGQLAATARADGRLKQAPIATANLLHPGHADSRS
jgi:hypothetical protein